MERYTCDSCNYLIEGWGSDALIDIKTRKFEDRGKKHSWDYSTICTLCAERMFRKMWYIDELDHFTTMQDRANDINIKTGLKREDEDPAYRMNEDYQRWKKDRVAYISNSCSNCGYMGGVITGDRTLCTHPDTKDIPVKLTDWCGKWCKRQG